MATAQELIDFEAEVSKAFEEKKIRGPIHLAGGNEEELIEIFKDIKKDDWVLSTWRSHYHALLKGVPRGTVMQEILKGRSMSLHFPEYKFMTSAIVGGLLPLACGLASQAQRVWCFVGDMSASGGQFHEASKYAMGHDLPVCFVVEDNGYATNTPTDLTWGFGLTNKILRYRYKRTTQHCGTEHYVSF